MSHHMNGEREVSDPNKWRRRIGGAMPLAALLLLLGIVLLLWSSIATQGKILEEEKARELSQDRPPVNVVALDLQPGPIREVINLPGVVHPWVALTVVAEVRGKVVEKTVTQGEQVREGDILARIDSRDYQNAYASARASYRSALAAYERIAALHENQVATRTQLDDATALMETTRAAMEIAALDLERCEIRSPLEGVVDRLPMEVGQFMDPGDPVADILQMDRVKIEVNIPESDVDAVRHVKRFEVAIDALNGRNFEGTYHYLARSAGNLARSYRLEVAVPNPDREILPDMFARVEIVKREVPDGLAVPLYALVAYQNDQAVYVIEGDMARRVPVRTGILEGWQVEITKGLAPGARVIVVGQREVSDGQPVKVQRTVSRPEDLTP